MLEKKYRGIGQGWARATYGGSTGGWEALATQVFYPDFYNGAYVACPDPVDFHAYQNINLYDDANAFVRKGDFGVVPIAADRKPDGTIIAEAGAEFAYEYVLGTHGRSTEQWDIWQAVFSPAASDGYPAEIINPLTGAIDKKVLAYWHDHYDLAAILKRDWPTLGPKLEGKLHIAVGDGDTYFLNNAVHILDKQLQETRNPAFRRDISVRTRHAPLLHRRSIGVHHAAEQRRLDAASSAEDGRAHARDCPVGCRHKIVALLKISAKLLAKHPILWDSQTRDIARISGHFPLSEHIYVSRDYKKLSSINIFCSLNC